MKCEKLKSGIWECYDEGPRDPITNKRNQIRRRGKTKNEAKEKVNAEINSLKDGYNKRVGKALTFNDVAEEWLKVYSVSGVKDNTIRSRLCSLKILNSYLRNTKIANINSRTLQNILFEMNDKKYSMSAMENVKVTAGMIFKYAEMNKFIRDNPIKFVSVPRKRLTIEEIENSKIEESYLERDELEIFLNTTIKDGLPMDQERFFLMAFTGMRVGEVCALKWNDINFETNEIRITKTMYMPNNNMHQYKLTPPKTKKAVRTIDIDEDIMKMLKKHKTRQAKIRLSTKKLFEDYHDKNFVFCRDNGYPFCQRNVYDRITSLFKKCGIKKDGGPHILRHTHITLLVESGVDLKTIMDRVGHEDSKTTYNIYTHVTEKMKKDAQTKMKNQFGDLMELSVLPKKNTGM